MYCCLALDLITVAPPWLRGSFQIQILLDPTRRGTTARMARYYRSHGTTAPRARYYRASCGTKTLLLPQPRYYRDPARYYRIWSCTKPLVPQTMADLPWLTSIACQLSRLSSMGFLCCLMAFALILFAFCFGALRVCLRWWLSPFQSHS